MKKLAFLLVAFATVVFSSCEGGLFEKKLTVTNPFDDLDNFAAVCYGNPSDGSVEFSFWVTNYGETGRYYFGWITAYTEDGDKYTTGSNGYKGYVDMPNGQEVRVDYDGDYNTLTGVDTSVDMFESLVVEVTNPNGKSDQITFNNLKINWE